MDIDPWTLVQKITDFANFNWVKKWVVCFLFISATSFSFFGFLEIAPIGIFNSQPTQYTISYFQTNSQQNTTIVANVSSQAVRNGPEGLEVAGSTFSVSGVLTVSLISSSVALFFAAFGVAMHRDSRRRWGEDFSKFSRISGSLLGAFAYCVVALIMKYYTNLINGDPGTDSLVVFGLGSGFHAISVFILLYQYGGSLTPDREPADPQLFIQFQGQVAQASLSVGLAVAIGGALTFARAGTRFALPVAVLVGIFLFPLAGIAAHRYLRNYTTELKYRYGSPEE